MSERHAVKVFLQAPCEALRPFVKRSLAVEFSTAQKESHLPDTGLAAAFGFKDHCILHGKTKAPQVAWTGLWDRARYHGHSADSGVVLAVFTMTGAAALLRQLVDGYVTDPKGEKDWMTWNLNDKLKAPSHAVLQKRRTGNERANQPRHQCRSNGQLALLDRAKWLL